MSEKQPAKRKYDSTVARIAGNILSGHDLDDVHRYLDRDERYKSLAEDAVALARAIVAEVERTEPKETANV